MSAIDLKHVARLARLHLSEEELKSFESQVAQILSFVEKLNDLKGLEKVEPTSHPLALSNVFREDRVGLSLDQARGRFFQVPKIIEDRS